MVTPLDQSNKQEMTFYDMICKVSFILIVSLVIKLAFSHAPYCLARITGVPANCLSYPSLQPHLQPHLS